MARKTYTFKTNDTVLLFRKICNISYLCCGTNFMFDDLKYSANFMKIFKYVSKIFETLIIIQMFAQMGAIYTLKNLPLTEKTELCLFGPTTVVLYALYLSCVYQKEEVKELSFTLAVTLKKMYSDREIEKNMQKKTWRFVMVMGCFVSVFLLTTGVQAGHLALTTNATFTTVPLAWPSLEDHSRCAGVVRFVHYPIWWLCLARVVSMYFIILTIAITLEHQFQILHKYFLGLQGIFEGEGSQEEKEKRYEDGFKHGIKMHALTLWCIRQTQVTCAVAFSAQVISNVMSLVVVMNMERTLANAVHVVTLAVSMLVGAGIFMWNAGDITFEAAKLPTAIFHSGWHNCRGRASARARRLLTIALRQAQDRIVLKALGVIELSYESFVSIVKMSYSLFSITAQQEK